MNDDIYFSGASGSGGDDFDTEAFKKRFNEVLARTPGGAPQSAPAPEKKEPPQRKTAPGTGAAKKAAPRKRRKKHVFAKILAVLLVLVLLVCGGAAGAVFYATQDYKPNELLPNAYADERNMMQSAGVKNILLMGLDTKEVYAQNRSDVMILLSIDTVHSQLKITSFMRDSYVSVPGHGSTKLGHACFYGGPQLTVDTIELNFGVKIDGYVKIGYNVFKEIVDAVGGITVAEIDSTESAALAKEGVHIEPGTDIHLNGHQALQYVRIRKGQSDFQRTERQREAIGLIVKQALKTNPVTLLKLARTVAGEADCSLTKTELLADALRTLPCLTKDLAQQQIPADGTWSGATRDGQSVLLVDTDANREILKDFIY